MNYKISSFFSDFCATKLGSNFVFLFLQKLVPKLATFVNMTGKADLTGHKTGKTKKKDQNQLLQPTSVCL